MNNFNLYALPPGSVLNTFEGYEIPVGDWIKAGVDFLVENFRPVFQAIRWPVSIGLEGIETGLNAIPPVIFIIIVGLLAWQIAGRGVGIFSYIAMLIVGFLGVWEESMVTLSLVITAVVLCVIVGIPIGIACARSDKAEQIIRPILDAMQTLPTFVYLVPVVMLFGIGQVPGVIVTFIFAVPPLIRLTNIGIRQVSPEVVEAAQAFGSTPNQVLWEAQIPLAMPTILAGVNQSIMMALSMVVVASMIAVEGLGQMVLRGIGRLDIALASTGGIGIVLVAVMLDRITQAAAKSNNSKLSWKERGPIGALLPLLSTKKGEEITR
ncbi:MAG: ABC transporter permease subunit [Hormoscilla sp. SP12CHS1]|nr:ABC transporter permease subunit [Hormoscilla sp. SP12CHS1]